MLDRHRITTFSPFVLFISIAADNLVGKSSHGERDTQSHGYYHVHRRGCWMGLICVELASTSTWTINWSRYRREKKASKGPIFMLSAQSKQEVPEARVRARGNDVPQYPSRWRSGPFPGRGQATAMDSSSGASTNLFRTSRTPRGPGLHAVFVEYLLVSSSGVNLGSAPESTMGHHHRVGGVGWGRGELDAGNLGTKTSPYSSAEGFRFKKGHGRQHQHDSV